MSIRDVLLMTRETLELKLAEVRESLQPLLSEEERIAGMRREEAALLADLDEVAKTVAALDGGIAAGAGTRKPRSDIGKPRTGSEAATLRRSIAQLVRHDVNHPDLPAKRARLAELETSPGHANGVGTAHHPIE